MAEVQALRPSRHFVEAVRQSDLPIRQKFALRVLYLSPKVRSSVDDYVDALVAEEAQASGQSVDTLADGTIIRIIIENLPQIIEFIELLIKLFG